MASQQPQFHAFRPPTLVTEFGEFAQQFSRGANALNDLPCSGRVLFCDVTMDDVTMDMVEMPPRATYSAAS